MNRNYIKIASHEAKKGEFKRCVLLYSGGLDTSVMLKWIQDEYKAGVIALTVDLGQMHEDLISIKKKAEKLGAIKALVIDDHAARFLSGLRETAAPLRPNLRARL